MWKTDIYFWRQIFILTPGVLGSIAAGVMVAFPSVLDSSLLSSNGTDIKATAQEVSWIAASNAFAGAAGFVLLPIIMQAFGRKVVMTCTNTLLLVGWIIFVFANNIASLFAARILQGFVFGATIITGLIVSEYSHPKRRGYFLVIKKLSISVGALICHSFKLFWTWRQIAGFCITFNAIALMMVACWKESPAFLALKGRFVECEESFLWLYGNKADNMRELTELIAEQKKKIRENKSTKKMIVAKFLKTLMMKDFLKAFLIVTLLTLIIETSGRHFFMAYSVKIMLELVGDNSLAVYFSIGIDILTMIALFLASIIIRYFKRRTLLFSLCLVSILLILLISLLIYLQVSSTITALLILVFSFVSNVGGIPLSYSMISEMFSLEHRGFGISLAGISISCIYAITLKVTPLLIMSVGLPGTFLLCAAGTIFSLGILYFLLPETKDRSLQEIEYEMKGINRSSEDHKTISPEILLS